MEAFGQNWGITMDVGYKILIKMKPTSRENYNPCKEMTTEWLQMFCLSIGFCLSVFVQNFFLTRGFIFQFKLTRLQTNKFFMSTRLSFAGRLLSQCRYWTMNFSKFITSPPKRQLQFHQCSLSSSALSPISSSTSSPLLSCHPTPNTTSTRSNTQHRVVLLPEYPGQV